MDVDFDSVGIIMWQQYLLILDGNSQISHLSDSSSVSNTWKVSLDWIIGLEDGEDAVAFLALYEAGSTSGSFSSHYFNITSGEEKTVSSTAEEAKAESTAEAATKTVVNKVTVTGAAAMKPATGSATAERQYNSQHREWSIDRCRAVVYTQAKARQTALVTQQQQQQQSMQSTQIHISQGQTPPAASSSPVHSTAGYAAGRWAEDNKLRIPRSPQTQPGYAPPQWNQQNVAEMGTLEHNG
ncbi:hypothetical protein QQZ08_009136 [Neonectria magnoliae]|uniref:Uncharacterized protein n=1 Tax=Neonectria magnoliae TaxID=2732573 RepID=A0ABR1HPT0_9HYPO